MRSTHAPKACITDEVCITHAVRITFQRNASLKNAPLSVDKSAFFVGGERGILSRCYRTYRLACARCHVSENSPPDCFLPLSFASSLLVRIPHEPSSIKNKRAYLILIRSHFGGERGIRTPERVLAVTRFPVVRLRPAQPSLHIFGFASVQKTFTLYPMDCQKSRAIFIFYPLPNKPH